MVTLASHMSPGSSLGYSNFVPLCGNEPGKTAEDDLRTLLPTPVWEIQMDFQVFGFDLA